MHGGFAMHNKNNFFSKNNFLILTTFIAVIGVFIFANSAVTGNDNTIRVIHATDIHIDRKAKSKTSRMLGESIELFKGIINQINCMEDIDMVVFSGDVVNKPDVNDFNLFADIASTLKFPWHYTPGNHDIGAGGGLSRTQIVNILNKKIPDLKLSIKNDKNIHYSYSPNKSFLFLFLDGTIKNKITAFGYFPKEELDWLESQLRNNPDKKVIIVQHFPVVEPFDSASHKITNEKEYLKVIDKYNNLVAVLAGHYHCSKIINRNNVLHITTPALVEYPNAYREIKMTDMGKTTKFEVKLIETNLKDIQNVSKSRLNNAPLHYGQQNDRNVIINLNK